MRYKLLGMMMAGVLMGGGALVPSSALGHCDTMDGPVVRAAKAALEAKDITPVLKWVHEGGEAEVRSAFAKTLTVRTQGTEARELADQFFFETLVRVHRAGEGAPYTGLKPAGTRLEPGIEEADRAMELGSVDKVIGLVTDDAAAGIRGRFAAVQETAKHAEHNVGAGRQFVAAYVDYVHYVEGVLRAAQGGGHHAEGADAAPLDGAHGECASQHKH